MRPSHHTKAASGWRPVFKHLLMAPVFPMAGYLLLDQTGISHFLVQAGWIPKIVLGEGFGHVGLCFSLHYVVNAVKAVSQQLFLRFGTTA
jgi:hypothetical protein